jgi:hypothetical protein
MRSNSTHCKVESRNYSQASEMCTRVVLTEGANRDRGHADQLMTRVGVSQAWIFYRRFLDLRYPGNVQTALSR